jgi:hypothetical protein
MAPLGQASERLQERDVHLSARRTAPMAPLDQASERPVVAKFLKALHVVLVLGSY